MPLTAIEFHSPNEVKTTTNYKALKMTIYHAVHGKTDAADQLLSAIGFFPNSVPNYRDCYLQWTDACHRIASELKSEADVILQDPVAAGVDPSEYEAAGGADAELHVRAIAEVDGQDMVEIVVYTRFGSRNAGKLEERPAGESPYTGTAKEMHHRMLKSEYYKYDRDCSYDPDYHEYVFAIPDIVVRYLTAKPETMGDTRYVRVSAALRWRIVEQSLDPDAALELLMKESLN